MARFAQLDRHSLYPVEQWGDTLVVMPRGDAAGFNPTTVNHEMATVTELVQSPGIRHLILDFSGANYFGSVVLGGLVQLTQTVKNRGGRVAICSASQDMQDILRIMKLDKLWEIFPDQRVALRRIASIPFRQQLWAWRKIAAGVAAVGLLILAYVFYPRPNYGQIYYEQVQSLWREYQELNVRAGEEEWERFSERSTKKPKPIVAHIDRRTKAGAMKPAELFVLYVARDHWPKALQRNNDHAREEAELIQQHLRYAEAVLEGRRLPGVTFSGNDKTPVTVLPPISTPSAPDTPATDSPNPSTKP